MKVVVRCLNCGQIRRRSQAYHVKVLGMRNEASSLERPNWQNIEEQAWLCIRCAVLAGYSSKHEPTK